LLLFFILSIVHLYKLKSKTTDKKKLRQLQYVLWGSGIAGTFGLLFGLIIASFPEYIDLFWIGRLSNGLLVLFATFAIFKYQLFNIKIITTELLTFSIWFILLIRSITSETPKSAAINWGLLAFITVFGLLLIRSVRQEVKTRQRLENVTTNLKHANTKLKKMDRQKSQMLSIASHQFRSPLTAIKGYASLLKDGTYGDIPEKMKEPISRILESSSNLANIVNDFLNISRIERGRMEYDFEIADLSSIAQRAVNEAQPTTGETIDLSFECNEDISYTAKMDMGKIRQVVSNLIDNAIKYTPAGSVHINVQKTHEGARVQLSVEDTGVGITKEDQMKIFGQFTRAKNANDVNVMGTGLGLYVAKKIIEAHDGRIWVESDGEGEGSTFYIELAAVDENTDIEAEPNQENMTHTDVDSQ
jgi:signal transduction histidine kinase